LLIQISDAEIAALLAAFSQRIQKRGRNLKRCRFQFSRTNWSFAFRRI